jgi:hypothetical protein
MSEPQDEAIEPLRIDQIARDARVLDATSFQTRHGMAFLLHNGPLDPDRRAKRPQRTVVVDTSVTSPPPVIGPQPSADLLVFPIRHTGRSPYPRIITVGRTKNNDIILADIVVSKFHAFFKEEGGKLVLQDADSRNGTFVDGKLVPSSKQGKAVEVKPGCKVKFGMIEMWFVNALDLQQLARHSVP